jgi:hypothetical protein
MITIAVMILLESILIVNFVVYFYFYWVMKSEKYVVERSVAFLKDNIIDMEEKSVIIAQHVLDTIDISASIKRQLKQYKLKDMYMQLPRLSTDNTAIYQANATIRNSTLSKLRLATIIVGAICVTTTFVFQLDGAMIIGNAIVTLIATAVAEIMYVEVFVKNILLMDSYTVKRDVLMSLVEAHKDRISPNVLDSLLSSMVEVDKPIGKNIL